MIDSKNIFKEELKNLMLSDEFKDILKETLLSTDINATEPKKTTKRSKKSTSCATRVITVDEYTNIIKHISEGFKYEEEGKTKKFRPNPRMAFALQLQANLGIRIGDVLSLTPNSFKSNGRGGYMIDIIEEKTRKPRKFDIPTDLYNRIQSYVTDNEINKDDLLFSIKVRVVQKQLKIVTTKLNLSNVSTHSFRKFYAMRIFENNDYNFEIVRALLQHSNVAVTQKYLGVENKQISSAISNHNYMVI